MRTAVSSSPSPTAVSNRSWKNSLAGTVRSPPGAGDDELGVEREHRGTDVAGGVGVHEGAADRAAVPDLRVGHLGDRLGQQRRVLAHERRSRATSL